MCKKIFTLLAILLVANLASAVETNWTGATDGDWAESGNWDAGIPTSADLAVIVGEPNDMPTIFSPAVAQANQMLLGQGIGNTSLTVESGAALEIGTAGIVTGWLGTTALVVEGDVTVASAGWFGLGNAHWDNPEEPFNRVVGHSNVYVDNGGTITADVIAFGEAELIGGVWTNTSGTGELFINDGTVTVTDAVMGFVGSAGCDRVGFNLSSADGGSLILPDSQPAAWYTSEGCILADSGLGTVNIATAGGVHTITAVAFDPEATPNPAASNFDWDNGGLTQLMIDHWNYTNNRIPRPGVDGFVSTGAAPYGSHPVLNVATEMTYVAIGWGVGTNDAMEITTGGELTIDGGTGTINIGDAGTDVAPGMGTLYMTGGDLYVGSLGVAGGGGDLYDNYSAGILDMTSGSIDCNSINMSTIGAGDVLRATGSASLKGGTINVTDDKGIIGLHASLGAFDIAGGTLIIEGDLADAVPGVDPNAEVAWWHSLGKMTAYAGAGKLIVDYDVRNAGKTTITACLPGQPTGIAGDVDMDCDVDLDDIAALAENWLFPAGMLILE